MRDENEEAIEVLLSKADQLNEWEIEFLENIDNIAETDSLSERQQAALDKIWRRVMG